MVTLTEAGETSTATLAEEPGAWRVAFDSASWMKRYVQMRAEAFKMGSSGPS